MAGVKREDGGDFMVGDSGPKKPAKKLLDSGQLDVTDAVAFLDSKKDGEALRTGLDNAVSALEALKKTGLTAECLIVLVENKCAMSDNRNPIPRSTVRKVLEAFFRLGEYVR